MCYNSRCFSKFSLILAVAKCEEETHVKFNKVLDTLQLLKLLKIFKNMGNYNKNSLNSTVEIFELIRDSPGTFCEVLRYLVLVYKKNLIIFYLVRDIYPDMSHLGTVSEFEIYVI